MAHTEVRRPMRDHPPIGRRLRDERTRRQLSLRDLAERLGVSPSLISQIETGRARPSVATLYAIVSELDLSLDDLLFPDGERGATAPDADAPGGTPPGDTGRDDGVHAGSVQRGADRQRIRLDSGVVWERLTSSSDPEAEFLHVTYEVGGASGPPDAFQRHNGREWGVVLSGTLRVSIGFESFVLGAGDAITIPSTTPHRLENVGDQPVQAVWFVLGRGDPGVGSSPASPRDLVGADAVNRPRRREGG